MTRDEPLSTGQRVRYVGITGLAGGPVGRVSRVCRAYVKVRWDGYTDPRCTPRRHVASCECRDGRLDDVHPDDIRVIAP